MEYHYRTITCPNCGAVAERRRTVDSQILKGSPFRVCRNCGKGYFDPDYKEEGLILFSDRGGEINFWVIVWFFLSHAGFVGSIIIGQKNTIEALLPGIIVFGIIALIIDVGIVRIIINRVKAADYHKKMIDYIEGRGKERSEELIKSLDRLSNKGYLDALKKHGVEIPEYFYDRLKKNDNNSENPVTRQEAKTNQDSINNSTDKVGIDNRYIFCRKCGQKIPHDSVFCPKCGEKVVGS